MFTFLVITFLLKESGGQKEQVASVPKAKDVIASKQNPKTRKPGAKVQNKREYPFSPPPKKVENV